MPKKRIFNKIHYETCKQYNKEKLINYSIIEEHFENMKEFRSLKKLYTKDINDPIWKNGIGSKAKNYN